LILLIFALGVGVGYRYVTNIPGNVPVNTEKNTPKAFVSEVYDKIKENYWDNLSDAELLDLFKLSMNQNGGNTNVAKFENKEKLLAAFAKATAGMDEEKKNTFYATVAGSVLSSLNPAGRSGLFTEKQEEQLKNTVSNINPEKDLYKDLGLSKGASEAAVAVAFEKKSAELKEDRSPEAKEKLKKLTYAKDTLTQKETKQRYDSNQVEPTMFTKTVGNTLYFQFKKFSPTSYDEFIKIFEKYKDDPSLTALIFDLRGNIGGAIDATPYFLGHFIGKGAYAYDFYHKGEYIPFKTPTDKLPGLTRFRQIVVLVDNQTQSSAEMMAASLKKYHMGVIVGVPTKGWGTVERVFPLDNQFNKKEKYSVFLVHSITLRDDNLPIEGRGVDPDIRITDPSWPTQLMGYFNNSGLVEAVKSVL
ncbi:MAG: S41 family peptidase, partial [Candidatus Daviesbacteria bacterium]|nr:S41 family peptidase [Candidatus Daviesbacteria bacterium]